MQASMQFGYSLNRDQDLILSFETIAELDAGAVTLLHSLRIGTQFRF